MLYLLNYKKYQEKSSQQLWDEDHVTFYWWVFGFIASFLVLIGLYLSSIIIGLLDKNTIINWLTNENPDKKNYEAFYNQDIIRTCFLFSLLCIGLIIFIIDFLKAIKIKTFAKMSPFPTLLIFILTFISFFDLIFYAFFNVNIVNSFSASPFYVLLFIIKFMYLFVYFIFSRNVALIRKISFFVKLKEERSEAFKNMMQNGDAQINGENIFNAQNNNASQFKNNMDDELYLRLNALSIDQLKELGKKLSISGFDSMKKEELLKIIYPIFKSRETSDNKEIVIDNDDKNDNKEII